MRNFVFTFGFLFVFLTCEPCTAQVSLQTILKNCPDQTLPFDGSKRQRFIRDISYTITNTDKRLYNRLYKDMQLSTSYEIIDGDMEAHQLFRKFSLPNSKNKLFIISLGGVSEYRTDLLVVVSPSGNILDQMVGRITFYPVTTMQYKISMEGQIDVSQLVPTTGTPVMLNSFTQFTACRVDKKYLINPQGKFQEISIRKFKPQNYTKALLESDFYDIWSGNEISEK